MKSYIRLSISSLLLASSLSLTSCIEDATNSLIATDEQIGESETSQKSMLDGLAAYMVTWDTYGTAGGLQDWGYPCFMTIRDAMLEDTPIYNGDYDYYSFITAGTGLRFFASYPYYYYYKLIHNANSLIGAINPETATEKSLQYRGLAKTFRAMSYLDLARMFEYKATGIGSLDGEAQSLGCYKLTVPIVDENITPEQGKNNPRVPYYTMYRFIMNDLNEAEQYLSNFVRDTKDIPDVSVVYGLKARLWLEMATRFSKHSDDLSEQISHESDADGYSALGISSANDCYAKAKEYAKKAIACGYSPVTKAQWHDTSTGFNTVNQAWMWAAIAGTQEQVNDGYFWNTFPGEMCSEASWGMPQYGGSFRMIGASLFSKISDSDWRKTSWVAPEDAGKSEVPEKYQTLLKNSQWKTLPAYANLKFRPGNGDITTLINGLIYSLPLMRVEEMQFIDIEATANLQGVAAGKAMLEGFMNGYRYTDGSYSCSNISSLDDFITEMLVQKRIEFWGEGLLFFDYKRLDKGVTRNYDGTNFLETYRLNSADGYAAAWYNFYIPTIEQDQNLAIILNPDASGVVTVN